MQSLFSQPNLRLLAGCSVASLVVVSLDGVQVRTIKKKSPICASGSVQQGPFFISLVQVDL